MRERFASPRLCAGVVTLAASLAGLAGCAPRLSIDNVVPAADPLAQATEPIDAAPAPPTVQVRYFSFSPTVSVVAWAPSEAGYGLRSRIRQNGSLIEDHRIYVSSYYDPAVRAFPFAAVASQPLLRAGISRDVYACYFGRTCSPHETFGARIPDGLLRENRDSVVVTFYAPGGRDLILTLHRELIDAYLAAVDSVSAALRRRS